MTLIGAWFGRLMTTLLLLIAIAACQSSLKVGPEAVAGLTPSGTVDMNEIQVAYIGSGGGGSGTLYYNGATYPFSVGGLGVGGIGASTIDAAGEVYKLKSVAEFPAHMARLAMVLRSVQPVPAISGCRTKPV